MSNEYIQIPLEFATDIADIYIRKKASLLAELAKVDKILTQVAMGTKRSVNVELPEPPDPIFDTYNTSWSNPDKATFVIIEAGVGLTTSQIADRIVEKEPSKNKDELIKTLSSVLRMKTQSPNAKIFRKKDANGNYAYDVKKPLE